MLPGADHESARDQRAHNRDARQPHKYLATDRPDHPGVSDLLLWKESVVHNFHGLESFGNQGQLLGTLSGASQHSGILTAPSQAESPGLLAPPLTGCLFGASCTLSQSADPVSGLGREIPAAINQCDLSQTRKRALLARGFLLISFVLGWIGFLVRMFTCCRAPHRSQMSFSFEPSVVEAAAP